MLEVKSLGVIGAGQMGCGIAHVAAQAGRTVVVRDLADDRGPQGPESIAKNLQKGVDKGKLAAAEKLEILSRIRGTTQLRDLASCDAVVEAVVEKLDVKLELFEALDGLCRPDAVLATNTSSLSITR